MSYDFFCVSTNAHYCTTSTPSILKIFSVHHEDIVLQKKKEKRYCQTLVSQLYKSIFMFFLIGVIFFLNVSNFFG